MGLLMRSVRTLFTFSILIFTNFHGLRLPYQKFLFQNQVSSFVIVPGIQNITLNQAIQLVTDGGVIEISPGVYSEFVEIKNSTKNFVIRAPNGNVFIKPPSGGNKGVFYLQNNTGLIIFEGLEFENGYSNVDGYGGAVTIDNSKATFVNCAFINNRGEQPSAGGGALFVTNGSKVYIYSSRFENNTNKNYGGAIALVNGSKSWIVGSKFRENKTNITGHRNIASGGAIHVGDSKIRVADSEFVKNEAGFAGGAIYSIGRWEFPLTEAIVVNSKFVENKAIKAMNVSTPSPNEGGAIHTEDNAKTSIYYSLFNNNQADIGGAVSLYRSVTEVYTSVFELNRASSSYFGGSVSATSNDTSIDGQNNRPSAQLIIRDSLFKGDGQSVFSKDAGAIYAAGDANRMYGQNNVYRMDTPNNRAIVRIENTAFLELSSNTTTGHGGAVMLDLVEFHIYNSLFFGNSSSNGGAISVIQYSSGEISDSIFIKNKSKFGGAIYGSGSDVKVRNNKFSNNELFNIGSNPNESYGASLFMAVMDERSLDALGEVSSNIFSDNRGLPIYDRDNMNNPINRTTYINNSFYTNTFQNLSVYTNSNPNYCCKNVSELNKITINRNSGVSSTRKGDSNVSLDVPHLYGYITQIPPYFRTDGSFLTPYVVYGMGGGSAYLNNQLLVKEWGFIDAPSQQEYILQVGEQTFSVTLRTVSLPLIVFRKISDSPRVEWLITNIQSSDLLDMDIDMVGDINVSLSGQLNLNRTYKELEYRLFVLTKHGGYIIENEKPAFLDVPGNLTVMFEDDEQIKVGFIPIYNVGGGSLSCQISTNSQNISILTPELSFERIGNIQFFVQQIQNRDYQTTISVSCGDNGYKDITLRILIVDKLFKMFLPLLNK
ncbi:MAG: hypothetical protein KatS3mg028_1396 [Bacteroidia bacterium]|nr:MAG: hypothetical protein KatS3mg028_1396 [Bacteroidia bacterium]